MVDMGAGDIHDNVLVAGGAAVAAGWLWWRWEVAWAGNHDWDVGEKRRATYAGDGA